MRYRKRGKGRRMRESGEGERGGRTDGKGKAGGVRDSKDKCFTL